MHGRARHALGQFEAALREFELGSARAAETGREDILLQLTVESVATLVELGRLADAASAGEEGVELARLSGNPRMLLWAHSALASARLAAGDVAAALQHAADAAEIEIPAGLHAAGQPGWCLGAALTAAGNPERAVEEMLRAFGSASLPEVLAVERPHAAADLVEAQLALGRLEAAEEALEQGEAAAARSGTGWTAAVTGLAQAAVLLARERPTEAMAAAACARAAAAGAPLTLARAQLRGGQGIGGRGRPTPRRSTPWSPPRPSSTASGLCAAVTRRCASCGGSAAGSCAPAARPRAVRSRR